MFTVELGKKIKEDKSSFENLEMLHQECCGGKIKKLADEILNGFPIATILLCTRCGARSEGIHINSLSEFFRTAIDGQKREIRDGFNKKIVELVPKN